MKNVLFATDTCKEAIMFMEELGNMLCEKQIPFDFDKHRMTIKTNDFLIVFVPKTSSHSGLFQRHPFDYYIFTGYARWEEHGFHKLCISRTKIGAKEIDDMDELIRLLSEE